MSGDDNYLSCNPDGSKSGLYNPFSRKLNYDVYVPDENTHCSTPLQGGPECADECCAVQDKYCQDANLLKELWPYYQCMLDRGCEGVVNTKISGNANLSGKTCNVGSSSEPTLENLKYAVPCFFDITCDHKCGSNQQGGDACNKDCCQEQESFCRDKNGNMGAYFQCMAVRGCRNGDFISCNQDSGTTYQVDTLIKSTHCDTYWQGNDLGCSDECCQEQHDYCLKNATGVADYYECMHDRSCGNTADELVHSKPKDFTDPFTGKTEKSDEKAQVTIDGEDKYCVVPNPNWFLPWMTVCAGDECDYRCGTGYMGGLPCQKKCCDYQKDKWCRDTNPEVRGYFHCMWVRGCKDQLSIDITGNKYQTGNTCRIPNNMDGEEKNFGVPCAAWGSCTEKCGSWQQGGAACRNKCCNKQEEYCRGANPTMEGYFKCMDDRGCPESKFISCQYDSSTNYDVYPPDSDDHCGTNRQGHHLGCTPKCCQKQGEYCTGAATCLQEHFRCMDDRGCKEEVKIDVNGNIAQTQKCDLPKDYWNAYDVPCDLFSGTCKYKCGSWLQGGKACRDDCCEAQDDYCRGANPTMEGYFECLIARGCKDEIKCNYDNGTNYDINPNDPSDHCGTKKQGVTYGETTQATQITIFNSGKPYMTVSESECKAHADNTSGMTWKGVKDSNNSYWKERPLGCLKNRNNSDVVYNKPGMFSYVSAKCGDGGFSCLQSEGCTPQCCEKQKEYCTGASTCLQEHFRCMQDRGCDDRAKIDINGNLAQTQKCDLPKDYWNPYDVPCDMFNDGKCRYKCGSWLQGGPACRADCCADQNEYCRGANPTMEGYFKCVIDRGCKLNITCETDQEVFNTTNYDVDVNDSSDHCGTTKQGKNYGPTIKKSGGKPSKTLTEEECRVWAELGSGVNWSSAGNWSWMASGCTVHSSGATHYNRANTEKTCGTSNYKCVQPKGCTPECCAKQDEYCTGATTCLQEYFRCMDDRGCKGESKIVVNGNMAQTEKCDLPKDYLNAYDVPCDLNGNCRYKCGSWLQGGSACKDGCCDIQDRYCRLWNGTMEDYFYCMKIRGCEEPSCEYDWGTNYDINVNDSNDLCGTDKQGGARCKEQCCKKQAEFCGCGVNDKHCMEKRGCSTTGTESWGFYQKNQKSSSFKDNFKGVLGPVFDEILSKFPDPPDGHTWSSKCYPLGKVCTTGAQCANHELLLSPGTQCCEGKCQNKKPDYIGTFWCPHEAKDKFDWFDKKKHGHACSFDGDCQSNMCRPGYKFKPTECFWGCCTKSGEDAGWSYDCKHAFTSQGGTVYPKCVWGCCKSDGTDKGWSYDCKHAFTSKKGRTHPPCVWGCCNDNGTDRGWSHNCAHAKYSKGKYMWRTSVKCVWGCCKSNGTDAGWRKYCSGTPHKHKYGSETYNCKYRCWDCR